MNLYKIFMIHFRKKLGNISNALFSEMYYSILFFLEH